MKALSVDLPTSDARARGYRASQTLERADGRGTPAASRFPYKGDESDSLRLALGGGVEVAPLVLLVLLGRGTTALSSERRNANAVRSGDGNVEGDG